MKRLALPAFFFCLAAPAYPRGGGGGGCFEENSPVLTPSGPVLIQRLKPGDEVVSGSGGKMSSARVKSLYRVVPESYFEITAGGRTVRVTGDHPFRTAEGVFTEAAALKPGDALTLLENGKSRAVKISSVRPAPARNPAYGLLVFPGGEYFAGGFLVHNKGCFLPDTRILKADGAETAISAVKPGDALLSFTKAGKAVKTRVLDIISAEADYYFELKTGGMTVRATAEHPFYTGGGTYKTLEALKPGDTVFIYDGGEGLASQIITSIERIDERTRVYNLHTDSPNTFFANYTAVHNKGGACFAAGTLIYTPAGRIPIERVQAGKTVYAYEDGKLIQTEIRKIFTTTSPVLTIWADGGRVLNTTAEHPLLTGKGFAEAGTLKPGDEIFFYTGERILRLRISAARTSKKPRAVYNLEVGPPHSFLAGGFIVHNKGGFGRSHYRSGSRSSGSGDFTFMMALGVIGLIMKIKEKLSGGGEEKAPDVIIPGRQIARKAGETEKLLQSLADSDPALNPALLKQTVTAVFNKLQLCWTSRDYSPMKNMLTPYLYASHSARLETMRANNEINVLEDVQVRAVDLVFVNYAEKPEGRLFTALITASAGDYYLDDRDNSYLRGNRSPREFQEFWSFHFRDGKWLLAVIEQTTESQALSRENVTGGEGGGYAGLDGFTAAAVAGAHSSPEAGPPAGPALSLGGGVFGGGPTPYSPPEPAGPEPAFTLRPFPASRNWSRTGAELAASLVFLNVYAAWEKGDAGILPKDDIFPGMQETIRSMIQKYRAGGLSFRFENLAVSKAVPVLVKGQDAAGAGGEFIARICARARRTLLRNGETVYRDPFVTPFTEYWVFEKEGDRWKLRELLPRADGRKVLAGDDQETDPAPVQLEWYYRPGGTAETPAGADREIPL